MKKQIFTILFCLVMTNANALSQVSEGTSDLGGTVSDVSKCVINFNSLGRDPQREYSTLCGRYANDVGISAVISTFVVGGTLMTVFLKVEEVHNELEKFEANGAISLELRSMIDSLKKSAEDQGLQLEDNQIVEMLYSTY